MSCIRGGHNLYQIQVGDRLLYSHTDEVHLLLALQSETVERHREDIVVGGGIICDDDVEVDSEGLAGRGIKLFRLPLVKIAGEVGDKIMSNTAALGWAAGGRCQSGGCQEDVCFCPGALRCRL
jgi:2-oxoglutarate ferredoxin oxidoreductase subunit alpha